MPRHFTIEIERGFYDKPDEDHYMAWVHTVEDGRYITASHIVHRSSMERDLAVSSMVRSLATLMKDFRAVVRTVEYDKEGAAKHFA
jgi:hypothetical protein